MEADNIVRNLHASIKQLLDDDFFLLQYDVHERTIAHRLALYLENKFEGFHVDCEYNNDLDSESGRKKVYVDGQDSGANAYPDIIVHHRGLNGPDHNLLVLEIKKTPSVETEVNRDREKLCSYTACDSRNHLFYKRGALVVLGVKDAAGQCSVEWYKDGRQIANSA